MSRVGELVSVAVGVIVILGVMWRFVVLPNLREQLYKPVAETKRQVTENRHANPSPTVLDRLDDLGSQLAELVHTVDAIGLTQSAVLRVAGKLNRMEAAVASHVHSSEEDRRRLWLIIESLIHEEHQTERMQHDSLDTGGEASEPVDDPD